MEAGLRARHPHGQQHFLGHDQFGHPQFDTQRSPMGDLLYRLKYQNDLAAVEPIVEAAVGFVRRALPAVDLAVPVPASRERPVQPVLLLCERVAQELRIAYEPSAVHRTADAKQLKDVFDYDERWRLLKDLHAVDSSKTREKSILLFDDLFRSGATMNSVSEALLDQGFAREVFALTVTRTRSKQ